MKQRIRFTNDELAKALILFAHNEGVLDDGTWRGEVEIDVDKWQEKLVRIELVVEKKA